MTKRKARAARPAAEPPQVPRNSSWIAGLFAAALVVKLTVLWQLHAHPLLQADAGLDTTTYAQLAQRLASGDLLLGRQTYFVSPLYIYFTGLILWMTGSFTAVRIVQAALGACAVVLVYRATRVWFSERAARAAALFCISAGILTFYEVLLIQAALDPFLIAASVASLASALNKQRGNWFALSGLCFGISVLNRPNVLVAAVVIALALVVTEWRRALWFVTGLAIALAPVTVRNGIVAGDWSPLPSQGGLNFYIGNNPTATGVYGPVAGVRPSIEGQQIDARVVASRALGHQVSDREASSYFYRLATTWIVSAPRQAASLYLRKLWYVFNGAHIFLNYSYPFFAFDARTLLIALPVGAWLLLPLGLVGLAHRTMVQPLDRRFAIWASFVPVYAVSTAAFFAADRYRLPLLIPTAVGAGGCIDWLIPRLRSSTTISSVRYPLGPVAALGVLLLVVNWPANVDDGRPEERARMAERLIQLGRFQEADAWASLAEPGFHRPAVLRVRIGRQFLQQHQWGEARAQFERAAQFEPDAAEVQYRLGEALLESGDAQDAVGHLRAAVERSPELPLVGYHLARALAASGERQRALAALQHAQPSGDERAQNLTAFGELAIQLQAPQLAEGFLRSAIRIDPGFPNAHQQLGLVLGMSGRLAEAEAELRQAVTLASADPAAHLNLAVVFAEEGRIPEARAEAETALRLQPGYAQATRFLAALPR